ncbi:MAG: ABC transporter substrate-binding protein [Flavobacteriales bacterium]|nr:ABC transporter substrate-binding protein [Flavobacteriales bacterium]
MRPCAAGVFFIPVIFILFLTSGCGQVEKPSGSEGWRQEPMHHARFFQIWERGSDRMLLTFGPGGNTDTTGVFVQAGDSLGPRSPSGAVSFRKPLQRVALQSTTHASFITMLGCADAVVGCAHTGQLLDEALVEKVRAGEVKEIASADGVDRERILMLAPDALFTYPYGSGDKSLSNGAVPEVPVAEYLEEHPLGRAEWLKAFGVLLGREALSDSLFAGIEERYEKARASVPAKEAKPLVFFGSAWKGTWSVPSGNSYMARLIGDAGGRYLFADRNATGNIDIDLETVLQEGAKADRWGRILVQDGPVTAADLAGDDARILQLRVFKEHGCFYANSAQSDLFGQAVLEPDVVVRDLIGIFHPALEKGSEPVYYKPVQ